MASHSLAARDANSAPHHRPPSPDSVGDSDRRERQDNSTAPRYWPQPLLGIITASLGLLALWAAWWMAARAAAVDVGISSLVTALVLGAATIVSYRFPLHVRPKVKIYLASVPLYLLVALVPAPLAATAGAGAVLIGELSVRRRHDNRAADIGSEVGRRIVVLLVGAWVLYASAAVLPRTAALLLCALALEGGDIVSAPLVLTPMLDSPASPLRTIVAVARDAWLDEGAQYLLGFVGALAATQAVWAPALLVVPIVLVYLALNHVQEARHEAESAQQRAERARGQAEEAAVALQHQALHDALTGLPNRTLLYDRLNQALHAVERAHGALALGLMDLDRFKEVNDTLGHQAGDALLRQVAARMQSALRTTDTVARLGGDEFAVLLPATDEKGAVQAMHTLLAALTTPLVLEGHTVHVGASAGIAIAPAHGMDVAALLRRADIAMYVAKRSHSGVAVYDVAHDRYSPTRLSRDAELRRALAADGLTLHYQPTAVLSTGCVAQVEALVRWPHPRHGLLSPDQFIPLAEQTGLIVPLTNWVLERALGQCQEWTRQGREMGVAVNLSTRALRDPRFPDRVASLLHRYAVSPALLTLEITESALMADPVQAQEVVARLAALDVHVAIDDFGTGYSSLAYLKQLPVDEVKIDKSFVRSIGRMATKDTAIVRSIVELGHNLGLLVVAEGVEDADMWERIRELGCDVAQGYYLSRPLPLEELTRWLDIDSLHGNNTHHGGTEPRRG